MGPSGCTSESVATLNSGNANLSLFLHYSECRLWLRSSFPVGAVGLNGLGSPNRRFREFKAQLPHCKVFLLIFFEQSFDFYLESNYQWIQYRLSLQVREISLKHGAISIAQQDHDRLCRVVSRSKTRSFASASPREADRLLQD